MNYIYLKFMIYTIIKQGGYLSQFGDRGMAPLGDVPVVNPLIQGGMIGPAPHVAWCEQDNVLPPR